VTRASPKGYDWATLRTLNGEPLEAQYLATLHKLGAQGGMLGAIFFKAQNKIQDPAKLNRLVQMIDEQAWVGMDADTKGDLYEGLLQKNAEDTKSGAGQYFTPRALIQAMVACMRPKPRQTIADPACGTGGFFLAANEWLTGTGPWLREHGHWLGHEKARLTRPQQHFLRDETFHGNEIVPSTRRMCLMNLVLHGIGDLVGEPSVERADALIAEPRQPVDLVLANPPFGKKSSMTITNEDGEEDRDALLYERQDFWETTSNKQLNFLQHIVSMLKVKGRAAVVLPDNVLFEGGAGEKIRRKLLETCDVHTILRLPTGIFYAQGVKANVVFFDNLFWLKDDSLDNLDDLPSPQVLQQEIIEHLEAALAAFRDVAASLPALPTPADVA
jgi:type I restriction enzyme M protein